MNEAGELGGGGGAGTLTPLQGGDEGGGGTGDEGGGEGSGGEGGGADGGAGGGGGETPTFASQLFNQSGSLAENWESVMTENGLEKAIPYFGREALGGKQDSIMKGLSNLIPLIGKKASEFSAEDVGALSDGERTAMLSKLQPIPESAEAYDIRGLDQFKGKEVSDEFVNFWSKAAHELQVPQDKVAQFFEKNSEWADQFQQSQGKAEESATAEQKTAVANHFKQEWGGDFHGNSALVNTWADQNLDPANPLHVAMLNDTKGLEMVFQLAKGQDEGRMEGSLPKGGADAGASGSGTYVSQFDKFVGENPAWQNGTPEIRNEGERLSKLAYAEDKRTNG